MMAWRGPSYAITLALSIGAIGCPAFLSDDFSVVADAGLVETNTITNDASGAGEVGVVADAREAPEANADHDAQGTTEAAPGDSMPGCRCLPEPPQGWAPVELLVVSSATPTAACGPAYQGPSWTGGDSLNAPDAVCGCTCGAPAGYTCSVSVTCGGTSCASSTTTNAPSGQCEPSSLNGYCRYPIPLHQAEAVLLRPRPPSRRRLGNTWRSRVCPRFRPPRPGARRARCVCRKSIRPSPHASGTTAWRRARARTPLRRSSNPPLRVILAPVPRALVQRPRAFNAAEPGTANTTKTVRDCLARTRCPRVASVREPGARRGSTTRNQTEAPAHPAS